MADLAAALALAIKEGQRRLTRQMPLCENISRGLPGTLDDTGLTPVGPARSGASHRFDVPRSYRCDAPFTGVPLASLLMTDWQWPITVMRAAISKSLWRIERIASVVVYLSFHHASAIEKTKSKAGPPAGFSGFW
jgi:hypothetical protein